MFTISLTKYKNIKHQMRSVLVDEKTCENVCPTTRANRVHKCSGVGCGCTRSAPVAEITALSEFGEIFR